MNDHFADVSKKDTMSLTLALIVLDRSMLLNWIAWTLSKRKPCIFHAFPGKEKGSSGVGLWLRQAVFIIREDPFAARYREIPIYGRDQNE